MRQTPFLRRVWVVWAALLFAPVNFAWGDVAGSKDHPMLSRFPGTSIIAYRAWPYDLTFVPMGAADRNWFAKGDWVKGKTTWVVYQAPANVSTLQLYRNYETALKKAGFQIEFSCQKNQCGANFIRRMLSNLNHMVGSYENWMPDTGRYLTAKLPSTGGDVRVSLLIHQRNTQGVTAVRLEIIEPSEPRPFEELRGSTIGSKKVDYDEARIAAGKIENNRLSKVLDLEGKIAWNIFRFGAGVSTYEAYASWKVYLKNKDYELGFGCALKWCGSGFIRKVVDLNGMIANGGENWSQGSGYYVVGSVDNANAKAKLGLLVYRQPNGLAVSRLLVVSQEPTAFDQITATAESLAEDIEKTGKVAVYGIYFDTDAAAIKPQSDDTLGEIARLLEIRPELALYVDGHTDDQGADGYNLDLSHRRASAVVEALVAKHAIDASRLEARGFGENAPVDSNETDAGRAKNRRVELVARKE